VQTSLRTWLGRAGIEADWSEDVTRLTNLQRYKAVIFASTSRDALFAHGRAIDPTLAINLYEISGAGRAISADSPSESALADRPRCRAVASSHRTECARRTVRRTDSRRWERCHA
jgi:hypothetical protein